MARACLKIRKSDFSLYCLLLILTSNPRNLHFVYSQKTSLSQAFILECMMDFFALIMQTFSMLFLILYTMASDLRVIRPRAQEDHLADSSGILSSSDVIAEIPGNQPTTSGETTGNTEPEFEQQQQQPQQTWLKGPGAPLLASSANAHCNNGAESFPEETLTPSQFRRSSAQHAKRQGKNFCTAPEPQELQNGGEIPSKPEKKGPKVGQADSDYSDISIPIVQNIIMLVRMWGIISQGPHEEVCGPVEVPICAPFPPKRRYPTEQQSFSQLVVPVRFCRFFFCVDLSNITLPSFSLTLHILMWDNVISLFSRWRLFQIKFCF